MITERLTSALADRYRVERHLGAGGMATVYLAEDLRHKRKVALKVLKPELAAVLGAERFVQEITTTASLSHPHILPLFDSGTADGFLYYVMPFIEGETLRDKLSRETQLGIDEAVRIATEVADALDYAHRHGVIHRDIKPENILLHDGRPMVADFGIALAVSAAAGGRMTETGLSLGTPHYMSPEQATAEKEITGRSDVYSLASVLYEMLAGQPPHLGGNAQQIIMKIIADPARPVSELRKSVPLNVAAALAKALEKLPADRFESAAKFAEALGNPAFAFQGGASTIAGAFAPPPQRRRLALALGALAAASTLLLIASLATRPDDGSADAGVVRFVLAADPTLHVHTNYTRPFALSADGRTIVFPGFTDSLSSRLWVRTLDDPRNRPIDGTEGGANAAISPDGQWIAFIGGGSSAELMKVRVTGGSATTLARLESASAALSWASNEEILFEQIRPSAGIHRIASVGGRPELAIPFDTAVGETSQRRPLVLRDQGLVVYGSRRGADPESELVMHRTADGRRARLGIPGIGALGLIDDHLVYARDDGTLMAVEIDLARMETTGGPVPLEPRVSSGTTGSAVGLSEGGTLVYRGAGASTAARLELVDTLGNSRALRGDFGLPGPVRFSPDGRRLAVGIAGRAQGPSAPAYDLWIVDLATGEPTRLTSHGRASAPAWMPGGRRIVHAIAADSGRYALWSVSVEGAGESRLIDLAGAPTSVDVHPDGRSVITTEVTRTEGGMLTRRWIDGSGRVDTLVVERPRGVRPMRSSLSPDGRFVAYVDGNSWQVYVRSLTGPGELVVSVEEAFRMAAGVWGRDGRALFYGTYDGLVAIELETSPTIRVVRRRLFREFPLSENYDLSPDGRTFAAMSPTRDASGAVVAVNWAAEARRAIRRARDGGAERR